MNLSYFLGANSYEGFYSLYDGFVYSDAVDRLYIIKGGAGCGKSSFMKKVAAAAESTGLSVERVICSGDPDSLDGIFIPTLKLAYVDGTAPHAAVPFLGLEGSGNMVYYIISKMFTKGKSCFSCIK